MQTPFTYPIPVNKPYLPPITDVTDKINGIWETQILTNHGKLHNELEEKLSITLGGNVSLFSNGTLALMIALRALDITGGEVITTPFTFPATPHSITWSGAKPIFCDVNSDTMCIDATKIEALITKDTKAILATHLYGIACDV